MRSTLLGLSVKKFFKISLILILLFNTGLLLGQHSGKKVIHPLMGSVSLSLEGGTTLGYTDYAKSRLDFIWRTSAEYFFNTFTNHLVGLKVFAGNGTVGGNQDTKEPPEFKTDLYFIGAGITYGYIVSDNLSPTISAAFSYLNFDPRDRNGNQLTNNINGEYSKNDVNLNLEAGLRNYITSNFSINFNLGVALNFNDWLDDIQTGTQNDLFFTGYLGLSYTIDARVDADKDGVDDSYDICPDTPAGLNVDENGCPIDTDRDGVPDYLDQCPNTPARVQVYENGCPFDSDRDGVPDYADRCPKTPPNVRVNRSGCPQDSDYDGVPDYFDRCPQTPRGVRVDSLGCPSDADGDRVPDYADKCPNTPIGVLVNNQGCPLDTDGDGVADYMDKCPNTPPGTTVTLDGCSDIFQEYVFNASTLFNAGEAILTPNSYDELSKVVSRIKLRPNAKWRIEGHTDERGDPQYNKILSLQRAQSVYNYFISQGLRRDNFEVVGLGEDFPIADNNTAEGRRMNRRVVLIRID
jgi:outer membrane protein OmpA-like peptidoglycan-associated protein